MIFYWNKAISEVTARWLAEIYLVNIISYSLEENSQLLKTIKDTVTKEREIYLPDFTGIIRGFKPLT